MLKIKKTLPPPRYDHRFSVIFFIFYFLILEVVLRHEAPQMALHAHWGRTSLFWYHSLWMQCLFLVFWLWPIFCNISTLLANTFSSHSYCQFHNERSLLERICGKRVGLFKSSSCWRTNFSFSSCSNFSSWWFHSQYDPFSPNFLLQLFFHLFTCL